MVFEKFPKELTLCRVSPHFPDLFMCISEVLLTLTLNSEYLIK